MTRKKTPLAVGIDWQDSSDAFPSPTRGKARGVSADQHGAVTCGVGRGRLACVAAFFTILFAAIAIRMVDVGVLDFDPGRPRSLPQANLDALKVGRANIVDRNGEVLATSLPTVSLYAKTQDIINPVEARDKLLTVLSDLDPKITLERLTSGKSFAYLKRNLTPREQYDVNALGIPGLHFEKGERRVYPQNALVAHVVGLTDVDGHGIAGIEKRFDSALLSGTEPLTLSLDIRLQTVVYNELTRAIATYSATGATGVVMDVNTGEVLAMVSLPDFNPNDPVSGQSEDARFNRATKGVYEMGSTFKLFNTAMALDSGKITVKSSFDATQPLRYASHQIRDDHAKNRWLTVEEILLYSSNIGSARMALEVGTPKQKEFMGKIGMLAPSPLELPEIGHPLVPRPWREINTITISFGHGLSVSPIQMITGLSAMVNGGMFRPATLLKREHNDQMPGERVISTKTSEAMRSLMRGVVVSGTGKKADVPGYRVGGKTGTAEKAAGGGYRRKSVLSSFVAVFPTDAPRYAVVVILDEPQGIKETYGYIAAGWNAAPVTGRVISQIAPIMGIFPQYETTTAQIGAGGASAGGGNLAQAQ